MSSNPLTPVPAPISTFARPRILPGLPLLSRSPTEVQFGQVMLIEGSRRLYEQARAIDGTKTFTELLAESDHPKEFRGLVTSLCEAGLLEDPDADSYPARLAADAVHRVTGGDNARQITAARARAAVVVHGAGRVAIGVATGLAAAGMGQVSLAARGMVDALDCGTGYRDTDIGRPRDEVAAELVRAASSSVRTEPLPAHRVPELVVLADTPAPDPGVVAGLHAAGVAHLLAYPRGATGTVGPLVIPRHSGCVHCLDLRRTDLDPAWPRLAAQLRGKAQPVSIALAGAIIAFTIAQALLFVDGRPVEALRDGAVDIDPDTMCTTLRSWDPHPRCGCAAAQQPPLRHLHAESSARTGEIGTTMVRRPG